MSYLTHSIQSSARCDNSEFHYLKTLQHFKSSFDGRLRHIIVADRFSTD